MIFFSFCYFTNFSPISHFLSHFLYFQDTGDISQDDNAGGEDSNDVRFFANLRNSLVETNSLPKRPTWHRNGKIMPLF